VTPGDQAAGARLIPDQVKNGTFRSNTDDEGISIRHTLAVKADALSGAGSTVGVTKGEGELYGALAPNTGRGGGLEKRAASTRPQDYVHVPGYAGHRPDTWAPHYARGHFGVHPEGADSKGESHVSTWGRPPMPSGAAFEKNPRLQEGPPKLNAKGLFKADVEDTIDGIGKAQMKMVGDTCYASLRKDKKNMTRSGRAGARTIVDGSPKALDKTLNRDPDGYAAGTAGYNDLALFEGFYPPSRRVPGYSGHIPAGSRT